MWFILSISIFRRLSLFRKIIVEVECSNKQVIFQSPFSGDFLCFAFPRRFWSGNVKPFNLHFQETFFVSLSLTTAKTYAIIAFNLHFQETFFVSKWTLQYVKAIVNTFNLHFQETFFVSKTVQSLAWLRLHPFQSPFSGDFLCFLQPGIEPRWK